MSFKNTQYGTAVKQSSVRILVMTEHIQNLRSLEFELLTEMMEVRKQEEDLMQTK